MEERVTDEVPPEHRPYAQEIRDGDTVYVSGQGPVDSDTGEIVGDDIIAQTQRTLENVGAVPDAAGAPLADVMKATVFVRGVRDDDAVNDVYGEYMTEPYPARRAVEVDDPHTDSGGEVEVVGSPATE